MVIETTNGEVSIASEFDYDASKYASSINEIIRK